MAPELHFVNSQQVPTHGDHIELSAKPKTDIYAAPKHGYVFSAPAIYQKMATRDFKSATVGLSLTYAHTYDQGGLLLVIPSPSQPDPNATNSATEESAPKWVKAGVEVNQGVPQISVVGRDGWADWSLGSLPPDRFDEQQKRATLNLKMERHGNALAILVNGEGHVEDPKSSTWRLVREIQWVFCEEREDVWIGIYAARPDAEGEAGDEKLVVTFGGFRVNSS